MLESTIESHLRKGVERLGGMALKFVSPGNAGVPDRIVLLHGRVWFVELKTKTGRLTTLQRVIQQRIRDQGLPVVTLYGVDQVEEFLEYLEGGQQ